MDSPRTRSILAAAVVAVLAYIMFEGTAEATRIAVAAILAIVGGVFTALFFAPSRHRE